MRSPEDIRALRRDKYDDDPEANMAADLERLAAGEPLAYVIGWIPFLGLKIHLDSFPLIPRPETEWWTEQLIAHLREKFGNEPFSVLDLCAGSGAIGLAVLKELPHAELAFGELIPEHCSLIHRNIDENELDNSRVSVCTSDLFESLPRGVRYDIIVSNPPYVPATRKLPKSVSEYEPHGALFAGEDGLSLIRQIAMQAKEHLRSGGEVWVECDAERARETEEIFKKAGAAEAVLHTDQYGRPRLVVSYW